ASAAVGRASPVIIAIAIVIFFRLLLVGLVHPVTDQAAADGADGPTNQCAFTGAGVRVGPDQPADGRPTQPTGQGAGLSLGLTTRDSRSNRSNGDNLNQRATSHGAFTPEQLSLRPPPQL